VIAAEREIEGETKRNDRLIAVARASLLYSDVKDLSQLNSTLLKQIEAFFVNYQKVREVNVRVLDRQGPAAALAILHRSQRKA
jgi:inorganic pyrophosphatase